MHVEPTFLRYFLLLGIRAFYGISKFPPKVLISADVNTFIIITEINNY
jgi:hypothetical protein